MNHLRELLDVCRARQLCSYDESTPRGIVEKETIEAGERSICFDMGDIDDMFELDVIGDLCQMPYENCWFECVINRQKAMSSPVFCGLLVVQSRSAFNGLVFARKDGNWGFCGAVVAESFEVQAFDLSLCTASSAEICGAVVRAAQSFLSALHCKNIQRKEHRPDAKLQKARQKRGKAPLFSNWTLEIKASAERGANLGGTHSSPRVHLRRGHPRQYQPGKWTWVQPCAVGNVAAGVVHKDYAVGNSFLN